MVFSDAELLFGSANPEVLGLFDEFLAFRRGAYRPALRTLPLRARFVRDHGASLEDLGAAIPGLPVLEAMLSPGSPVGAGAMKDQADLVDEGIEDAYATIELRGLSPRNPARPRDLLSGVHNG